jgi:CheY-like chemotaxis protein
VGTGTIRGVSTHPGPAPEPTLTVLVYSDDRTVRAAVRSALGRRPAAGLPLLEYVECATEPAAVARMDAGGIDLAVLDGEAVPAGGMGICRQLKDEIYRCPPVLVLVGRPQDAWLATWSRADAVVSHPLDPIVLAQTAAGLLAGRLASPTGA